MPSTQPLTRYAWLSIAGAVITIALKTGAFFLTGSVGLLSDALESLVNLVAAIMALAMLIVAARPPDEAHAYGHNKAEYFSSGVEGALVLVAAVGIVWTALPRLLAPEPLEQVGLGLAISLAASAVNFGIARILFRAGRLSNSIVLEADAHHLMTDVWTSVGVLVGIVAVPLTGWQRLDPIVALVVAANIVRIGVQLLRRSALGLMDTAIPAEEQAAIDKVLEQYRQQGIQFHALRTRQAGTRQFLSLHILVPGDWPVWRGHQCAEQVAADIRRALPTVHVFTHLEALDDPASWLDTALDQPQEPAG